MHKCTFFKFADAKRVIVCFGFLNDVSWSINRIAFKFELSVSDLCVGF